MEREEKVENVFFLNNDVINTFNGKVDVRDMDFLGICFRGKCCLREICFYKSVLICEVKSLVSEFGLLSFFVLM